MKSTYLLPSLLLAATLQVHAQQPAPLLREPQMQAQPQLTTSKDWQNPDALRDKLGKQIEARLKGTDEASLKSFLQSPANRLLLANYALATAEIQSEKAYGTFQNELRKQLDSRKNKLEKLEKELPELGGTAVESTQYKINKLRAEIASIEAEMEQPIRLADVVKRPRGGKLIGLIANDLGWIGDVVYSGECIMPGRMLNMLANMMQRYTRMLPDDRMPRDIATATALEFARYGWSVDAACKRAEYFVRNWRQDRLHKIFDTLPLWQRRVVCGWKGDHSSGTPESLTWALYNVNITDERYTGCCWRCGYVLHNVYGEIVHAEQYYSAFEGMYTGRHHQFTQDIGGVCGSLSHFGASAACAAGVPALTMGEPGHCAYVVWVDGKWTPSYSISWDRGIHWRPWLDNWRYSSLHQLTGLQSPEQKDATRLSNAYRMLAHMAAAKGDTTRSADMFLKAEAAQPLHYQVYREHADMLTSAQADTDAWLKLNASLCTHMVPIFAECAAELMRNQVYDQLQKSGATAAQLETAYAHFWQQIRELGPERWKVQDILDKQIATLNTVRKNSEQENTCTLYRQMLAGTISNPDYATYSLESGNTLMQKMNDAGKTRILNLMTEAIGNGQGSMEGENRSRLVANVILAAENNRDTAAFQSVSKLIAPEQAHDNRPIGEFAPFPGKLVSEGGVVFASSTSKWDKPATHANVLTRLGGQIHTGRDKDPWIAVKLPKHATISGVVIMAHTNGNNWKRLDGLQVQISETGKDDDWHNAGSLTGKCTQRELRIDLTAEQPKALYVRVIRPGAQEVFHIDGIFVFGTPAA